MKILSIELRPDHVVCHCGIFVCTVHHLKLYAISTCNTFFAWNSEWKTIIYLAIWVQINYNTHWTSHHKFKVCVCECMCVSVKQTFADSAALRTNLNLLQFIAFAECIRKMEMSGKRTNDLQNRSTAQSEKLLHHERDLFPSPFAIPLLFSRNGRPIYYEIGWLCEMI